MSQEVENEALGATSTTAPVGDAPAFGNERMSFAEKVTTAVLSLLGTIVVSLLGLALKRRKQAQGLEDAAWDIGSETMKRQQVQIETLQKELETVRTQRNAFESAAIRAEANSRNAADAAARAADAASRNEAELIDLQTNWERAQRYIRVLRSFIVSTGHEPPAEPV